MTHRVGLSDILLLSDSVGGRPDHDFDIALGRVSLVPEVPESVANVLAIVGIGLFWLRVLPNVSVLADGDVVTLIARRVQ